MKHTPGPWKWFNGCSWWRLGRADAATRGDGGDVLRPTIASDGHPDLVVSEADRNLIVAAPEMYAELKAIRNEMQVAFSRSEPRITHQWLENRIKRMDAAIRKAEEGL